MKQIKPFSDFITPGTPSSTKEAPRGQRLEIPLKHAETIWNFSLKE